MGEMSANFDLYRKTPSVMQEFKILVSIGVQISAFSFSNLTFIPLVDIIWSNFFNSDKKSVEKRVKSNFPEDPFCREKCKIKFPRESLTLFIYCTRMTFTTSDYVNNESFSSFISRAWAL